MLTIQKRRNFRNLNDEGFVNCSDVESFERVTGKSVRGFVDEFGLVVKPSEAVECDFADAREYFRSLLPDAWVNEYYDYPYGCFIDDNRIVPIQLDLF